MRYVCRTVAEHSNEVEERKRSKRQTLSMLDEERAAYHLEKETRAKENVVLWTDALQYLTALPTHGSKKPESQTWQEYFEQGLGREVPDVGRQLSSADLPFQDVIVVVTQLLGSQQAEVKNKTALIENATKRAQKRKVVDEVKDAKAKAKLEKLKSGHIDIAKQKPLGYFHVFCNSTILSNA